VKSHLSEEEINKYQNHSLSPSELLELDEHMENCTDCATRLMNPSMIDSRTASLQMHLQTAEDEDHLEYEELIGYLTQKLKPFDREIVEKHLQTCAACAADEQDLRKFRKVVDTRRSSQSFTLRFAAVAAAIIFVTIGAALYFLNQPKSKPIAFVIQDGPDQISFNKDGHLVNSNTKIGKDVEQQIQNAFEGKGLQKPPMLSELQGKKGVLLSGENPQKYFHLIEPVGTVVRSDHPTFRWDAQPGITDYTISIYDTQFHLAAQSPLLSQKEWTVDRSLERGKTYVWILSGHLADKTVKAPLPPEPEAKFKVLSSKDLEKLNQKETRDSHLLRGFNYLQYGLVDDASHEWLELSKDNPDSKEVTMLLESLQRIRQPK
jgi:hypothetical protein